MTEKKCALRAYIAEFNRMEVLPGSLLLPATTREQLLGVLSIRYQPAHLFELVIESLLCQIQQEGSTCAPLADALRKNLAEEKAEGGADYGPPHVLGRRAFFIALGLDYQAWEAHLGKNVDDLSGCNESVRELIGSYKALIQEGALSGGTAMLYWEGRIPRLDYTLLIERVNAEFGFPLVVGKLSKDTRMEAIPAMWHLVSHAKHDEFHEEDLINGVVESITSEADIELVKKSLRAARAAWDTFWVNLISEVFSENPHPLYRLAS